MRDPRLDLARGLAFYPNTDYWEAPSRYFSHFAWQSLFVVGLYIGAERRKSAHAGWTSGRIGVVTVAATLALGYFVLRWLWPEKSLILQQEWGDKRTLGVVRLVEFLSWATIFHSVVPARIGGVVRQLLYPLLACGRHSLTCFAFTQVASYAAEPWAAVLGRTPQVILLWDMAAIAIMFLIGIGRDRRRAMLHGNDGQ